MGLRNNRDEAGGLWDRKTSRRDRRLSEGSSSLRLVPAWKKRRAHLAGKSATARQRPKLLSWRLRARAAGRGLLKVFSSTLDGGCERGMPKASSSRMSVFGVDGMAHTASSRRLPCANLIAYTA